MSTAMIQNFDHSKYFYSSYRQQCCNAQKDCFTTVQLLNWPIKFLNTMIGLVVNQLSNT